MTTHVTGGRRVDKAQYGLAAALAIVGVYTIVDARGLNVGFGDPVGPRVFPYVIGSGMMLLSVLLAAGVLLSFARTLPAAESKRRAAIQQAAARRQRAAASARAPRVSPN